MSVTKGWSDSVEEFKEMWKGMTVKEIHEEILKVREIGEI